MTELPWDKYICLQVWWMLSVMYVSKGLSVPMPVRVSFGALLIFIGNVVITGLRP